MLGDFFTKLLQGNLFRVMRDAIMGHIHFCKLEEYISTGPKERVGTSNRLKQSNEHNVSLHTNVKTTIKKKKLKMERMRKGSYHYFDPLKPSMRRDPMP